MRFLRLLIPTCLLFFGVSAAFADGTTDPRMTMGGSGSCNSFSEDFFVQSFVITTFDCPVDFTNNIVVNDEGIDIVTLVATVTSPFSGLISCALAEGAPLNTFTVSSPTSCTFAGSSESFFIGSGTVYSLMFQDTFASMDSMGNLFADVTLSANPAPEPSTILCVCLGLAALLAASKKLKVAASRLI
jgi:hypothetical protein